MIFLTLTLINYSTPQNYNGNTKRLKEYKAQEESKLIELCI